MTFLQAQAYLNSFVDYERINDYSYAQNINLERILFFLKSIGNPHKGLRAIHVAGTKGKGSTCAFIASILQKAGLRVGLYTSPHLQTFQERIRILDSTHKTRECNGIFADMISEADICRHVECLKPAFKEFTQRSSWGALTFFEAYTAIAFLHFKEQKVDFAVLETGLGGRLDATNVADSLACIITPISYEHAEVLGSSLEEIAQEKAGIIKNKQQVVVVAPQEESALQKIESR
ncbi:bifunctional folylpolyglutamate synthase/dihydrofolate synthase, partial [Candidatus Omnitrophota bacterium]